MESILEGQTKTLPSFPDNVFTKTSLFNACLAFTHLRPKEVDLKQGGVS